MKRTPFKRKSFEEIKASQVENFKRRKELKQKMSKVSSKPKKGKKLTVSKLHEDVWDECKRIIRKRNDWICYTCGKPTNTPKNTQTGHGLSKGSLSLRFKYDLRNLKIQCIKCNLHEQGNQEIFLARLEKEEAGLEFLKEAGYKDENGAWRCKKEEPINARDYLTDLLEVLKSI